MQNNEQTRSMNRRALLVALTYLVAASLWILVTDHALDYYEVLFHRYLWYQTAKGLLFVALTTLLVYILVRQALVAFGRREVVEGALAEMTGRLQVMLDAAPMAIYALDLEGRVTLWNPAAEAIFGWTAGEVLGQPLPTIPSEDFGTYQERLWQALRSEARSELSVCRRRKDGFQIDFRAAILPLNDAQGRPTAAVVIGADITHQRVQDEARQLMGQMDRMILQQEPLTSLLAHACTVVSALLRCELVWMGMRGPDGAYHTRAHAGERSDLIGVATGACRRPGAPACSCLSCRALSEGTPIPVDLWAPDAPAELAWLSARGLRTALVLPIASGRQVTGVLWLYSRSFNLTDPETVRILQRVTEQAAISLKVAVQMEQIRLQTTALESAENAVVIADRNGVIQWTNVAFTNLTGYSQDEVVGRTARLLNSGTMPSHIFADLWRTVLSGGNWRGEIRNRRKDGSLYLEEQTVTPVRDASGAVTHFVAVKQNITERKRYEERLQFLGTHDPITGLVNRQALADRLASLPADGSGGALIILDLDGFGLVSDTAGYQVGDLLMQEAAALIKSAVPGSALLTRTGTDEFAILLPGATPAEAQDLARHLAYLLRQARFNLGTHEGGLTFCAGVIPVTPGTDPKESLLLAQLVLRQAKESGPGFIRPTPEERELQQLVTTTHWGTRLKDAIRDDRLLLHYQPVVDLKTGRCSHAEVLLRLQMEDGTVAPAGAFLNAAEQFRFMREIDRWVLARVLDDLEQNPDLRLFMNLSGHSLRDDTQLNWIRTRLQTAGPTASRLVMEITETTDVGRLERLRDWMAAMTELGCQFALDDLGQGFSSLSYLTTLPTRYVKIDGSFVVGIDRNEKNRMVVQALVGMSRSMGKMVVAEWVEDAAAVQVLQEMGVDLGQGYYLGRPGPLRERVLPTGPDAAAV